MQLVNKGEYFHTAFYGGHTIQVKRGFRWAAINECGSIIMFSEKPLLCVESGFWVAAKTSYWEFAPIEAILEPTDDWRNTLIQLKDIQFPEVERDAND